MNKEWYEINVKDEVIKDAEEYFGDKLNWNKLKGELVGVSIRNLMDSGYVGNIKGIGNPCEFSRFISDRYFYYRNKKYGQQGYWEAARKERKIGYSGDWFRFLFGLLNSYCKRGDKVLFVGTADGSEIPNNQTYKYYALEQLKDSVDSIRKNRNIQCYEADFEDYTFLIENGHMMDAIFALRCLMPNTRLDRFFKFAENNLKNNGVLILSHPMFFLDIKNNIFTMLPDARNSLESFDQRLKAELLQHGNMQLLKEINSVVEYFYIIRLMNHESTVD